MVTRILKRIWVLIAILIILLAIGSSIFRALTPWAKQYKGDVESHLSHALGQPVTIKTMETGWYWFQPVLKLQNITVNEGKTQALHLKKLLIGVNIFKSLWNWNIQPGILYIDDLHLSIREHTNYWSIDGITSNALKNHEMTPEKALNILGWLSQQERLIIKDVSVKVHLNDGTIIPVSGLDMSIVNHGGSYKIRGDAALHQISSTTFRILGRLNFDPYHPEKTEGQLYFSANNIVAAQWHHFFYKKQIQVDEGKGGIALWVDLKQGTIALAQARIRLQRVAWHMLNTKKTHFIQKLYANLIYKPNAGGWIVQADHIQLKAEGTKWPENEMSIAFDSTQQTHHVFVKSILIAPLLKQFITFPGWLQSIVTLKPQGMLTDTQVVVKDYQPQFILTRFDALGWNAKNTIPETKNLSGVLRWQPEEGRLELDSEHVLLALKGYPEQKLELLNGAIDWKKLNDGFKVNVKRMLFNTSEISISTEGSMDRVTQDSLGHIQLTTDFSIKNIQHYLPYLPKDRMKIKLYNWLKDDIKQIKRFTGKMIIDGLAKEFPFDTSSGEFSITSHASGADVFINSKWPLIKDIEAYLRVKKRDLDIDIVNANVNGISVKEVNMRIDDIGHDKENLLVHGIADGAAQKMLDFILASPLKKKLHALKILSLQGNLLMDLHLEIPLYPENDNNLAKGMITFKDNTVTIEGQDKTLPLEAVSGNLSFNEHGVTQSALVTTGFGHPLNIAIQSHDKPDATTIKVEGQLSMKSLKNHFDMPFLSVLKGSFNMNMLITLSNQAKDSNTMHLKSSLKGLEVNLPPPLGKEKDVEMPLDITVNFGSNNVLVAKINYNKIDIALKAKHLAQDEWFFNIEQKHISADLTYNKTTNLLSGIIKRVHLPSWNQFDENKDLTSTIKPDQIPNLDLRINNVSVGDIAIGNMALRSHSKENRLVIEYVRIESPGYQLNMDGEWSQKGTTNTSKTQLKLTINDLENSLEQWHMTPAVSAQKGNLMFQGGWDSSIYDFSLKRVHGQLYLELKDGRITNLSPETEEKLGLGKLLSVLSLQTIPRRLKLDFSDLSKQGYSFDIFKGDFTIKNGIMSTQNSYIDGPVAYASMKGDLDLVRRMYDLNLRISPHITASLPIVATIAGGPVAGLAAWVANKIINQSMQKISGYSYKITGPWKQPIVRQLNIIKKNHDD